MLGVGVVRIFSDDIRVARMVETDKRNDGYAHVRIDAVPDPEAHQPRFLVVYSHKPLPEPVFPRELLDG
jgi:hypothetical protein